MRVRSTGCSSCLEFSNPGPRPPEELRTRLPFLPTATYGHRRRFAVSPRATRRALRPRERPALSPRYPESPLPIEPLDRMSVISAKHYSLCEQLVIAGLRRLRDFRVPFPQAPFRRSPLFCNSKGSLDSLPATLLPNSTKIEASNVTWLGYFKVKPPFFRGERKTEVAARFSSQKKC